MTLRMKLKRRKCWHDATVLLSALVLTALIGLTIKDHMFASFQYLFEQTSNREISYKISSGDTLWLLASATLEPGEDVRNKVIAIRKLNGLTPTQALTPGQIVRVPVKRIGDSEFRYTLRDVR